MGAQFKKSWEKRGYQVSISSLYEKNSANLQGKLFGYFVTV